jgi:hypothetical protein
VGAACCVLRRTLELTVGEEIWLLLVATRKVKGYDRHQLTQWCNATSIYYMLPYFPDGIRSEGLSFSSHSVCPSHQGHHIIVLPTLPLSADVPHPGLPAGAPVIGGPREMRIPA